MSTSKKKAVLLPLIMLLCTVWHSDTPGAAQQDSDDVCPVLVTEALQIVGTSCAGLGRNEACYGHTLVAATFQEEASAARFETNGDVAPLVDLEALVTKPADPDAGTWGVALMKVQADLPDESSAALTLVLFGDTEVTNGRSGGEVEVPAANPTCIVSNQGGSNINVRGGPGTGYEIVDVLAAGDTVVTDGRNAAGDWVRIAAESAASGWLYVPLVTIDCEIDTLAVVEGEATPDVPVDQTPPTRPMQAFTLRTGQTSACEQTPDGLLIDAPPGQRATVMVNGVQLTFTSAAFLTAFPDDVMTVQGLTGSIEVTAFEQIVTVTAGQQTTIPLTGLEASGPPTAPEDADLGVLPGLRRAVISGTPFDLASATDMIILMNAPALYEGAVFIETKTCVGASSCLFSCDSESRESIRTLQLSEDGLTLISNEEWEYYTEDGITFTNTWIDSDNPRWRKIDTVTITFSSPTSYDIRLEYRWELTILIDPDTQAPVHPDIQATSNAWSISEIGGCIPWMIDHGSGVLKEGT